jgi:predicted DNA-binding transcriptional regulator AlpA
MTSNGGTDRELLVKAIDDAGGLVMVADIGRRWGVSKARADEVSKRDDFPKPLLRIGRSALYVGNEVDAWRAATRPPGRPPHNRG